MICTIINNNNKKKRLYQSIDCRVGAQRCEMHSIVDSCMRYDLDVVSITFLCWRCTPISHVEF